MCLSEASDVGWRKNGSRSYDTEQPELDSKSCIDDKNEIQPGNLDLTRYRDWEKNGRCNDF